MLEDESESEREGEGEGEKKRNMEQQFVIIRLCVPLSPSPMEKTVGLPYKGGGNY